MKNIYSGMLIVKDRSGAERYVKILEIQPNAFIMKPVAEQLKVLNVFAGMLKIVPTHMQITAVTLPSSSDVQERNLEKAMAVEKSEACLEIGREYGALLSSMKKHTIARRFFISFEHDRQGNMLTHETLDSILEDMNKKAAEIANYMAACDNEIIDCDPTDPNTFPGEVLYTLLNREYINTVSYYKRLNDVNAKYAYSYGQRYVNIPITDLIAPEYMSFKQYKNMAYINHTYYKFAYITGDSGYREVIGPGWPMRFFDMNKPGIDVSIYFRKKEKTGERMKIRQNVARTKNDASDADAVTEAYADSMGRLQAGMYFLSGLDAGDELFDIGTLITVSGSTPKEVDEKLQEIINESKVMDMHLHICDYENYQAFMSSLPLAKADDSLWPKMRRNVLSEDAASAYLFTTSERNDPNGILLGRDSHNSNVIADFFSNKVRNHNVFICGSSGAGKTYSMILMAIRMRLHHIPIILLLPEKEDELRRTCEAMDGQFIQIGAGSANRINIMEIRKADDASEEDKRLIDGTFTPISELSTKIASIKEFFKLLMKKEMSIVDEQILDDALVKVYEKKGITMDNNTLFVNNDPSTRKYKEMPILSDLVVQLKSMGEKAQNLYLVARYFTTGSARSFDGQTNVSLDNEFTVIGLEHIGQDNLIPLGMFIAMDYAWSKIKEDKTKPIALFIDEWWKFSYNEVGAKYSMEISKTIRAYSGAMILASQQLTDINGADDGRFGKAVINNCKTKIVMGMEQNDLDAVKDILNLSEAECEAILNFDKGQALLFMGTTSMPFKFISTDVEDTLARTDKEGYEKIMRLNKELARRKAVKQAEEAMKQRQTDIMDEVCRKVAEHKAKEEAEAKAKQEASDSAGTNTEKNTSAQPVNDNSDAIELDISDADISGNTSDDGLINLDDSDIKYDFDSSEKQSEDGMPSVSLENNDAVEISFDDGNNSADYVVISFDDSCDASERKSRQNNADTNHMTAQTQKDIRNRMNRHKHR